MRGQLLRAAGQLGWCRRLHPRCSRGRVPAPLASRHGQAGGGGPTERATGRKCWHGGDGGGGARLGNKGAEDELCVFAPTSLASSSPH